MSFERRADGSYVAPGRVLATLTGSPSTGFTFKRKRDLVTFKFGPRSANAAGYQVSRLLSTADRNNLVTTLAYSPTTGLLNTVTDDAGRSLVFGYTNNRLTKVSDPAGREVQLGYTDQWGNLTTVSNVIVAGAGPPVGGWPYTTLIYNDGKETDRLTGVKDPNQNAPFMQSYSCGKYGEAACSSTSSGNEFSYTIRGGDTTIIDAKGFKTIARHDGGAMVSITQGADTPRAATTRFTRDLRHQAVTSLVDPLGRRSESTYDADANVTSTKDALNRQSIVTYYPVGHQNAGRLWTSRDPSSVTTTFTYDAWSNVKTRETPLVGTVKTQRTQWFYDDDAAHLGVRHLGDVTRVVDPEGQPWLASYELVTGHVLSRTDPENHKTTYGYTMPAPFIDRSIGWVTSSVAPKGNVPPGDVALQAQWRTAYAYEPDGLIKSSTDTLARATVSEYDANRNLRFVADGNLNKTEYRYNGYNQMVLEVRPDGTQLKTGYDSNGNIESQTDAANQATRYTHDELNRVDSVQTPNGGLTRYAYDAASNLKERTNPNGNCAASPKVGCVTYTYDAANQNKSITYNSSVTRDVTIIDYDADGRRTGMSDGSGTSAWVWDSLGRMTRSTDGSGAPVIYEHDLNDRTTKTTYPNGGGAVTRHYDRAGRQDYQDDWLGNRTTFGYDENDNLTTQQTPNGISSTFSPDRADAVEAITHKKAGVTLAGWTYALPDGTGRRDSNGWVKSVTSTGVGSNESYGYDSLNQLTTVSGTPAPYKYDTADNLTGLTSGAQQSFDGANQLCWTNPTAAPTATCSTNVPATATRYGYDERGNRTTMTPPSGAPTTYRYDQENRMYSVTNANGDTGYGYDGTGLRTSKSSVYVSNRYTWDRSQEIPSMLSEKNASTNVTTHYIYGPNGLPLEQITARPPPTPAQTEPACYTDESGAEPLGNFNDQGSCENIGHGWWGIPAGSGGSTGTQEITVLWLHHDQLGSTRLLTNSAGNQVGTATYDPYGKATTTGTTSTLGYASEYTDVETGLVYLRARYYDPVTGQFLSRDPANKVTRAAYAYASNNPINHTDPSGLWCEMTRAAALGFGHGVQATLIVGTMIFGFMMTMRQTYLDGGEPLRLNLPQFHLNKKTDPNAGKADDDKGEVRRRKSKALWKEWEDETGEEWPQTEEGRNYDVSHDQPLADGGVDGWPNTSPMLPDDHRQMHKDRGDFRRWGARGRG